MIPADLVARPKFCVWAFSDDQKKLPRRLDNPKRLAAVDDETGFGTYEQASAILAKGGVDGLGILLGDGLAGIDIDDCRSLVTGDITAQAQAWIRAVDSYTEISPTGTGVKIFLRATLGRNYARKGLEVYGYGRYFTVTGRHLADTPAEPQDRSEALADLLRTEFGAADRGDTREEAGVEPATDGLVSEGGRNNTLTKYAGMFRRIGLDDEELLTALSAVNAKRCVPPLTALEVQSIVRSIAKYTPSQAESAVDELNGRHAVVVEAGKTVIVTERHDTVLHRDVIDRSSAEDIKLRYASRIVKVKDAYKPLGSYWLTHAGRREYDAVVFDPEAKPDARVYNLWKGFKIQPKPGDWSLFRAHLVEIVCSGDPVVFDFMIKWLARMFQKPGRPAETALAFRGRQGTGKGIVARAIGEIMGQHFLHITQARHVTGHFNAHLQDAVFVFADEAVAPQDKAGESALKTLITEPLLTIERKGKDAFPVRNVIHLMMASNHDWVAPANLDERRFLFCDVNPVKAGDVRYFGALTKAMKAGGQAAMLYDLLALDIKGWNHRQPPDTQGLADQKMLSMNPMDRWWLDKLETGRILPTESRWPTEISRDALHDDYCATLEKVRINKRAMATELGMMLRSRLLPAGWPKETLPNGRRMYELPSLDACRRHWQWLTKMTGKWTVADAKLV